MAFKHPMLIFIWCLAISSRPLAKRNLHAARRGIVPDVIMQITNGVWQKGRAGRAMRRIWASMDFRQRTVWTFAKSPVRTESGGPVVQLDIISRGLKRRVE